MTVVGFKMNFHNIKRELDLMGKSSEKFKRSVLTDSQTILLRLVQQYAPKNTGKYARTWKKNKIRRNKVTIKTTATKLYKLLEFDGRTPGLIRVKNRQSLRWFDQNGKPVFALSVYHPGFDAIPHVRPAMRRMNANLRVIAFANMDKLSRIFLHKANQFKPTVQRLKRVTVTPADRNRSGKRKQHRRKSI